MSFNVLLICENHRKDPPLILPIIRKVFEGAGAPRARVDVNEMVTIHGVEDALKPETITEVIDNHRHAHLFLLCVDRDGRPGREVAAAQAERNAEQKLSSNSALFVRLAYQEVEIWALAAVDDLPGEWAAIRADPDGKQWLEAWAKGKGWDCHSLPGRRKLGEQAASRIKRVLARCDDDLGSLQRRVRDWLVEG